MGSISLDAAGRLDDFYWQRLRTMVALTERSLSDTWVGFAWRGACEVRCEAQRDDGYGGVCVRIEVPAEWAPRVEEVITEVIEVRKPVRATVPVRPADAPPAVPVPERCPTPPRPPGMELRPELIALLCQMYGYMVRFREDLN